MIPNDVQANRTYALSSHLVPCFKKQTISSWSGSSSPGVVQKQLCLRHLGACEERRCQTSPQTCWIPSVRVESKNLCFSRPSRWFPWSGKFENHCCGCYIATVSSSGWVSQEHPVTTWSCLILEDRDGSPHHRVFSRHLLLRLLESCQ